MEFLNSNCSKSPSGEHEYSGPCEKDFAFCDHCEMSSSELITKEDHPSILNK